MEYHLSVNFKYHKPVIIGLNDMIRRIANDGIKHPDTKEPDPGQEGARFLAWLIKRNRIQKISVAELQWNRIRQDYDNFKEVDLVTLLSRFNREYVYAANLRGENSVIITREGIKWAEPWLIYYQVARGHHRHIVPRDI
ncbi:MAG: hypothetical protein QG666_127 [Euryarchaeota archaeon]|nr:hypothetical protein [Euryarchaeota archaeon]